MYAVIEKGMLTSIFLIVKIPTTVSSIFESKLLFGRTISSILYIALGNNLDSSQLFFIAPSLIELPLFNVERSTEISKFLMYKQESACSHSFSESSKPPFI